MNFPFLNRRESKETPPAEKGAAELKNIAPEYFNEVVLGSARTNIERMGTIEVKDLKVKSPTELEVNFRREGKDHRAIFEVKREKSGLTYSLHAEVFGGRGKSIFTKNLTNLDYSQVEFSLTTTFHQAFVDLN